MTKMTNVRYFAVYSSMVCIVFGVGLEKVDNSLPTVKKEDQTAYMNCSVINLHNKEQSQWNTKTHSTDDPSYISSEGIARFDLFVEERNKYSVVKYRTHNSQTYQLIIESLTEIEAGNYTCQIYLPNQNYEELPRMLRSVTIQIAPYITTVSAATVTVQEGENVTLVCEAYGYPLPNITWKRGDGSPLPHGGLHLNNGLYRINNINATDRGLFICTADNNIKPHAFYSVQLKVLFAPYCTAIQDTVGQEPDRKYQAILECLVSAEPRAEVVWYKENKTTLIDEQILDSDKYTLQEQYDERLRDGEKWYTLKINNVVRSDYREYYCTAQNELGKHQAKFYLFELVDCRFYVYTNGKEPSNHQASVVTYMIGFLVSFIFL
ncbi:lachesin-like [Mytilus galloprovincialis]|uniref:lachesin-like n=1 Tax=Mytilus galloprovincialis TaxID=29158 RepID=UPI003F7BEBD3